MKSKMWVTYTINFFIFYFIWYTLLMSAEYHFYDDKPDWFLETKPELTVAIVVICIFFSAMTLQSKLLSSLEFICLPVNISRF